MIVCLFIYLFSCLPLIESNCRTLHSNIFLFTIFVKWLSIRDTNSCNYHYHHHPLNDEVTLCLLFDCHMISCSKHHIYSMNRRHEPFRLFIFWRSKRNWFYLKISPGGGGGISGVVTGRGILRKGRRVMTIIAFIWIYLRADYITRKARHRKILCRLRNQGVIQRKNKEIKILIMLPPRHKNSSAEKDCWDGDEKKSL